MFDAVEDAAGLTQHGSRDVPLPAQRHVNSAVRFGPGANVMGRSPSYLRSPQSKFITGDSEAISGADAERSLITLCCRCHRKFMNAPDEIRRCAIG
jgi:hypothetical protein